MRAVKWGKRQLVFSEPANVGASFKTGLAGSYRVKLDMEVNGAYTPDPGKARIIFKIDGKEVLNQEFAYHDEKDFAFESTHKWQPGEHQLTIELQPTVPAQKKETIIDLFVHKVTIEGPLEKSALGRDRRTTTAISRARCPVARKRTSRLCEGTAGRVCAEGVSPTVVAARWR